MGRGNVQVVLGVILALVVGFQIVAAGQEATPTTASGTAICPIGTPVAGTPESVSHAVATPIATPHTEAKCEVIIRIVDFEFEPETIEVPVGTRVTWINDGPTDHTATAYRDGEKVWDSNILRAGESYSMTFDEPDSFEYLCTLHPSMTAQIDIAP